MKPEAKSTNIVTQTINDEVLVYDLLEQKAFLLNKLSTSIWTLCDGTKDISTISQDLSKIIDEEVSEDLVFLAIDQFKRFNLLLPMDDAEINSFNRREAIKRIGLKTTLLMPLVSLLVAPPAASAGSICQNPLGAPDGTVVQASNGPTVAAQLKAQCRSCKYLDFKVCNPANPSIPNCRQGTCCSVPNGSLQCV